MRCFVPLDLFLQSLAVPRGPMFERLDDNWQLLVEGVLAYMYSAPINQSAVSFPHVSRLRSKTSEVIFL
jgi:hypothetical protein